MKPTADYGWLIRAAIHMKRLDIVLELIKDARMAGLAPERIKILEALYTKAEQALKAPASKESHVQPPEPPRTPPRGSRRR